jgi:tetratricopeptide (TPR) repeat protein
LGTPRPQPPPPQSAIRNEEVLDLLTGLMEKSLVDYEERETGARYRLLETIRQYAREKLAAGEARLDAQRQRRGPGPGGDPDRAWQRHRDYYVSLAEEAARHIYRAEQAAWQQRLEREHDNLRAALEWSLTGDGATEAALRLVGALGHFWLMGSHLREGGAWTTRALASGRNAPPLVLARALTAGWYFAFFQGDYTAAGLLGEEALAFARQAQDRWTIGLTLFFVAIVAVHGGEYQKALACAEEGIALAQAEGDRQIMGYHLVVLGTEAWMRGDYVAARTSFRETLQISRELADEWHIGITLANLGFVTRGDGDCEEARALHREGLPLCHRLADRRGIGWHLVGMAGVEAEQGRAERAARLLGAAAAALEAIGSPLPPPQQREHDRTREQTEAALGEGAFAAAWAEGRAMPLEEAIRYALEEVADG